MLSSQSTETLPDRSSFLQILKRDAGAFAALPPTPIDAKKQKREKRRVSFAPEGQLETMHEFQVCVWRCYASSLLGASPLHLTIS